jgi:ABC-2 type transport system ATP-binding protein
MADLHHLPRPDGQARAQELLEQFDLVDAADTPAVTYSGGMKRRLDLAMTLVGSPRVIFLDEPTTGLDPRSRRTMWEVVRALAAGGVTIFLTTQYLDEADEDAAHGPHPARRPRDRPRRPLIHTPDLDDVFFAVTGSDRR